MNQELVVEVVRGSVVESRHRVAGVVVDSTGSVVDSFGDPELPTPPRSAIKSLQALSLVASGAADAYEFTDANLALSVASHSGEPGHTDAVAQVLGRLDLTEDDLELGPELPLNEAAADAVLAAGGQAGRLTHNCSGKHMGFLTLARHRDVATKGYLDPNHPVQQEVLGTVAAACEVPVRDLSIDGCGAPVLSMPLRNLAKGFATMVDPNASHAAAAARLRMAIAAEPWFMAGTGRIDTRVCEVLGQAGYIKGGAEGVYCGALVESGLGFAIKTLDGARRAAEVAIVNLLIRLEAIHPDGTLADAANPEVKNASGTVTGEMRAVW